MLSPLIGQKDTGCRTFTKSGVPKMTGAGKVRRNNDPQEISHLIIKPSYGGLGRKSCYEDRNDTVRVRRSGWPETPVFA